VITQQINLYHPIFRRQTKKFSAKAMLQATIALLLGTALIYGYGWWQLGRLQAQLTAAEDDRLAAERQMQRANEGIAVVPHDAGLAQEVRELEVRLSINEHVRGALVRDAFASQGGYSQYLAAFARQHTPGLWLTSIEVVGAGNSLSLAGRATQPERVPEYLQRLSAEPVLSGNRFEVFQMARPDAEKSGKGQASGHIAFVIKTAADSDDIAAQEQTKGARHASRH
jgi:Tfp pilus assembly protein PilN